MSPLERDVLQRKLATITANLDLLRPFVGLSVESYRADIYRRKAAERLLQEVVEAAVDINAHVLVATGRSAPESLHVSFLELGECGVIAADLARTLAPSAGLRNRLVHQYDRIDDALVLAAIGDALTHYPRYVAAVVDWLDSRGS